MDRLNAANTVVVTKLARDTGAVLEREIVCVSKAGQDEIALVAKRIITMLLHAKMNAPQHEIVLETADAQDQECVVV
jgi:hypothetical protein